MSWIAVSCMIGLETSWARGTGHTLKDHAGHKSLFEQVPLPRWNTGRKCAPQDAYNWTSLTCTLGLL